MHLRRCRAIRFRASITSRRAGAFRSLAYSPEQRERLLRALEGASPTEYCRLNFELGSWLADAAVRCSPMPVSPVMTARDRVARPDGVARARAFDVAVSARPRDRRAHWLES